MMKNVEVLKKARVLPAQIPELALRFGDEFKDVFTVEDMLAAIRDRAGKGGAL
jgi:energy-coupling factor transport system ATP-binding protein